MSKNSHSFDVEAELSIAFELVGGKRVASLLGENPGHKNADFIFPLKHVIAELKCLDEDKITDDRIIEKASGLYLQELQSGKAPVVNFGTTEMTTQNFSEEFKRKISELYRVPIERLVRNADRQIEQTAEAFKDDRSQGLFLLASNGHTALDPQHAWYLVNKILVQSSYPNINAAVVFSGNLAAALPGSQGRIDYWIEIQRPNFPPVEPAFLRSLRDAWHAHLARILGQSGSPEAVPASLDLLRDLESR